MSGPALDLTDQQALWNGPAGRAWVDAQDMVDELFREIEGRLADAVAAASAGSVLDIGCGTGSTTLAAARRSDGTGPSVGIDISAPMISVAKARAQREGALAEFIVADAQSYAFGSARFDIMISRFGVMFFADPIAAFANLLPAANDGAQLRFFAWRSPAENPFMTAAERAAGPLLPELPERKPHAPGQFAFADAGRVRRILEQSGWRAIEIAPANIECRMPTSELDRYALRMGPVGLVLSQADDQVRERIAQTVRGAFEPFVKEDEVRFTAACWAVAARAPG